MRDENRHKAFVDRVLEDTDRYAQNLLRENEKQTLLFDPDNHRRLPSP